MSKAQDKSKETIKQFSDDITSLLTINIIDFSTPSYSYNLIVNILGSAMKKPISWREKPFNITALNILNKII